MPVLLLIVLFAIVIAQIGFWDTLSAILGAVAMLVLLILIALAIVALGAWLAVRRFRRG